MTRLSRIHPYPAMIADEVAMDLSRQFVRRGHRVLDPFCGTGRTLLAAAERGAHCVGMDINPLATLLTRAKFGNPRIDVIEHFLMTLPDFFTEALTGTIWNFDLGRKVEWFSHQGTLELSALINRINTAGLKSDELNFVAAVLSATAREVSYCRDDAWKLHRIGHEARRNFSISALSVFKRRLRTALRDLARASKLRGTFRVITGDARELSDILQPFKEEKGFDVIITSPPYGDSRTTVQYGAMSGLCLGVLRHLPALNLDTITGGEIDRCCLGGTPIGSINSKVRRFSLRPWYWRGGKQNPARKLVGRFLSDFDTCCEEISRVLRRRGRAVFVIARRSTGGWKLNLDRVLIDALTRRNIQFEGRCTRQIEGKTTPTLINKNGHSGKKAALGSHVSTMREEHILVFAKA